MPSPSSTTTQSGVTQLLHAMRTGDAKAADQLLPLVYKELHRLAKSYMRRERDGHTLQPTALVNEAYMRLANDDVDWQNRAHFIGIAANVMRHVLVDYARQRNAQFRGGGLKQVELKDDVAVVKQRLDEAIMLDEALDRLAKEKPRQARIVELRYFGGLSVEQVASIMGIAPRSVKRDWALARIWLHQQLNPHGAAIDTE
jgi:RNA polymerase sigma-70 factor (ECF subfamily)